LPDNLKALFRPMCMMVPDIDLICEISLMSEGFKEARMLAGKMARLYKLCEEKLSKQKHYDFGLRTLKAALVMAGELKRDDAKRNEFGILMKALRDMNTPRFTFSDQELFYTLIEGLFANVDITRTDFPPIMETIKKILEGNDMLNMELYEKESEHIVIKTVHLYETMYTRHTTLITGPTCAGKTTIQETLRQSKTIDGIKTTIFRINPKERPILEL
jgi:dynein heavy chain